MVPTTPGEVSCSSAEEIFRRRPDHIANDAALAEPLGIDAANHCDRDARCLPPDQFGRAGQLVNDAHLGHVKLAADRIVWTTTLEGRHLDFSTEPAVQCQPDSSRVVFVGTGADGTVAELTGRQFESVKSVEEVIDEAR